MKARLRTIVGRARHAARRESQPPASGRLLEVEYPVHPASRWGYQRPAHPELEKLIDAGRERYAETLRSMLPFVDELAEIEFDPNGREPSWLNGYFQGLDAVSLYSLVASRDPATYLEVGAGNSTRFVRRAIARHGLRTRITSIDPTPRAALEGLTDEHIESPLESVDTAVFERLRPDDLLMIDGSHLAFMNSDVTVFFCEILPRLPAGLLVYIDDIFLPWDYPDYWRDRWYGEQYLLASWLLAGSRLEITLPNFWITTQPELHRILAPLWDRFTWAAIPTNGTGFWVTIQ